MAGATSPDNIPYMTTLDGVIDTAYTESLADAVQGTLTGTRAIYTFRWADATARSAQTGMRAGDMGFTVSTSYGVGVTYYYTGSAWAPWDCAWTAYVPALTNFNIGTGGVAANTSEWRFVGGRVHHKGRAFLGTSGSSVGTGVSLTMPITAATPAFTNINYVGAVTLFDAAPATAPGFVRANGTSTTSVSILAMSPTTGNPANITNLVPWTWGAGDAIYYEYSYAPA